MGVQIIACEVDADFKGISIARKQYTEVSGTKYYSELQRRAFRKYITNEQGQEIVNPDFNGDVDAWTGVPNFIATQFNF